MMITTFRSEFSRLRPAVAFVGASLFCAIILPASFGQVHQATGSQPVASSTIGRPFFSRHASPAFPTNSTTELQPALPSGNDSAASTEAPRPTRSAIFASWKTQPGAAGYLLDVASDPAFQNCLAGYSQRDIGNHITEVIAGLRPHARYFYRVRAYDRSGLRGYSQTMTAETESSSGLIINPIFDSSVTDSYQKADIEATAMKAIAVFESMFDDPFTVTILYRYTDTAPDGTMLKDEVAISDTPDYPIGWDTYISALKADASTKNDSSANASLPTPLITQILCSSASGRAVGLKTPPLPYSQTIGDGQPLDGIVTYNSAGSIRFARPTIEGYYDALTATEHEMDEILGLGSHLNLADPDSYLRPQDLFSWSAPLTRNTTGIGIRYFSIDRGVTHIVGFNQDPTGDFGDWASPDCPQPYPRVQNAFFCPAEIADISRSSAEGVNLDVIGYDLNAGFLGAEDLANISTRAHVEPGDGALIGGFIITGSASKKVLLRAIGPSLSLSGTLGNPALVLYSGTSVVASNDNWRNGGQEPEIIATGLAPKNNLESALIATLGPGDYTAVVSGAGGGGGLALVEVYDLDRNNGSTFGNISTRGAVEQGDDVLIGGVILAGGAPTRVVVRALGPSLPVPNPLANPSLELHDAEGTTIAFNDNWQSDQEEAINATGLAPKRLLESAILSTLSSGAYTAIVRGVNSTTGTALVEVYQVSN